MRLRKSGSLLPVILLLWGCGVPAAKYPAGSNPYPGGTQPVPQSQPQAPASYRTQHIWDKALQGMTMGGAFGGVYGAGAGLMVGLLTGLFTAETEYAQLNNQIQSEQAKDRELEAKLEQELRRQRELEARLAGSVMTASAQPVPEPGPSAQKPRAAEPAPKIEAGMRVASLGNGASPVNQADRPFKNVEVRDINGDTVPDLWIYYDPLRPGEIVRQEESTRGDGRVDTWSYFRDGKLVRREVDTKGKGTPDTVYRYENDQIVREERDENGTGHVTFRADYQNGRKTKMEKDTTGGGKPDTWIYYDASTDQEIVLKEERDLNGDGTVDLWSYYENGRLSRRDLSAAGLELVSAGNQLPSLPADSKDSLRPQLVKGDGARTPAVGARKPVLSKRKP